jgi:hypothetical protein
VLFDLASACNVTAEEMSDARFLYDDKGGLDIPGIRSSALQPIESLVPPFNLDCYFQHFSRKGAPVPLGVLGPASFIHPGMLSPHADALEIPCDPSTALETIELRATCSEGVLGLVGLTAIAP